MREMHAQRRWFRFAFGMRTMLIILSAAGCWLGYLGYYVSWIHQRHELLRRPYIYSVEFDDYWLEKNQAPPRPPWPLMLLGEPGWRSILVAFPDNDLFRLSNHPSKEEEANTLPVEDRNELERIRGLFPEARVEAQIGATPSWFGSPDSWPTAFGRAEKNPLHSK